MNSHHTPQSALCVGGEGGGKVQEHLNVDQFTFNFNNSVTFIQKKISIQNYTSFEYMSLLKRLS